MYLEQKRTEINGHSCVSWHFVGIIENRSSDRDITSESCGLSFLRREACYWTIREIRTWTCHLNMVKENIFNKGECPIWSLKNPGVSELQASSPSPKQCQCLPCKIWRLWTQYDITSYSIYKPVCDNWPGIRSIMGSVRWLERAGNNIMASVCRLCICAWISTAHQPFDSSPTFHSSFLEARPVVHSVRGRSRCSRRLQDAFIGCHFRRGWCRSLQGLVLDARGFCIGHGIWEDACCFALISSS